MSSGFIPAAPLQTKVDELVTTHVERNGLQAVSAALAMGSSQAALHKEMFGRQIWSAEEGWQTCTVTPWCAGEVRALVDGSYVAIGLRFETVRGGDLKSKVETMTSMTVQAACRFAETNKGFVIHHNTPGTMLVVPPGFIVQYMSVGDGGMGVRWSYVLEAEVPAVQGLVSEVLRSYPVLKTGAWAQWSNYLATVATASSL